MKPKLVLKKALRGLRNLKKINHMVDFVNRGGRDHLRKLPTYWDIMKSAILYGSLIDDYFDFQFWKIRHCERKRFLTVRRINWITKKTLQKGKGKIFGNKAMFNETFSQFLKRDWLELPGADAEQFAAFARKHTSFIIKPYHGLEGIGVRVVTPEAGSLSSLYEELCREHVVVEELVKQSADIAAFNPDSINTFRVVTLRHGSQVDVLAAAFRMGRSGSVVDNYSIGGVVAAVDPKLGIVTTKAKSRDALHYVSHPDTQKIIVGYQIPCWEQIVQVCKDAADVIPEVGYIGWDICLNEKNEPVVIEGNAIPGSSIVDGIDLEGKWPKVKAMLGK